MLPRHHVQLYERLRDDCDLIISMLIREDETPTIHGRSVERVVRLLRQPRLLFDAADGWPPLEDFAGATGLERAVVDELASELIHLTARTAASPPVARTHAAKPVEPRQAIESLRRGCAEVALWHLRQWLDGRITAGARPALVGGTLNASAPVMGHMAKPPPLRGFDGGPSLGFRRVGGDRVGFVAAVLLERANEAHEATLQAVRSRLASHGVECFQSTLIDLACVLGAAPQIVEAKSIAPGNEVEQVRTAYGQLHDYRFRHRDVEPFAGRETGLWVALSAAPCDDWAPSFLHAAGICLVWLGENGRLAGPDLGRLRL